MTFRGTAAGLVRIFHGTLNDHGERHNNANSIQESSLDIIISEP
jgi:hypothetical protein